MRSSGVSTGRIRHTLLSGVEIGRQLTDNFRNTGFFNNAATSVSVPYADPTISTPVTFRQSATDADNHLRTRVAAAYGQDQVELSRFVQLLAGVRFDAFDLQYHNNRNGDTLSRADHLVSPRAGIVVKPMVPLSLYGSYSVSLSARIGRSVLVADDDHRAGKAGEIQQLRSGREVGPGAEPLVHDGRVPARSHQHAVDRS